VNYKTEAIMTNRIWYLIQAPARMDHPFKYYNGIPIKLAKGDWFTSNRSGAELIFEGYFPKRSTSRVEINNAWHPSLDDCLLNGFGTHVDVWPACKKNSNTYKTTIKLDDIMPPRFKFAVPHKPDDYKEIVKGIGIFGAKIKKGENAFDEDHGNLIKNLRGGDREIHFEFLDKKHTDGSYESVIGFDLFLSVKSSRHFRLAIDPVIRNTGGDPN